MAGNVVQMTVLEALITWAVSHRWQLREGLGITILRRVP